MKRFAALLCAVLLLPACATPLPAGVVPDLTFENVQPVVLGVSAVEVVGAYEPPLDPPHIGHRFRNPPYKAARTLLERQLVAGGGRNVLRAVIEDASIVSEDLPVTQGFMGLFRREPANMYKATVSLRFELYDPAAPGAVLANAEVYAVRTRTLLEGASPAERERAAFELTEQVMNEASRGIATTVRQTFK